MGLGLFKDDYSDFKDQATNRRSDNINPDPRNFIINRLERVNEFTILEVTYQIVLILRVEKFWC